MPLASEVANSMRKLAAALDTIPNAHIARPVIAFYHYGQARKEEFLTLARVFPRPFEKVYEERETGDLLLKYSSQGLTLQSSIPRSQVCRIVQPAREAVYECDPVLSAAEEATLEHSHATS